ncbi:esterase-like activity of phytase family protein [Nocardia otitidiscaviarum]|uniref:esterase-like activity of phytase family protein n=1 Tax=Nocardia otitidiscaviarum TaxID=1823 RepID=UPI002B4B6152|nr:esterase-like activity of phytase family protein [Nocardia otitidiscaviarum]
MAHGWRRAGQVALAVAVAGVLGAPTAHAQPGVRLLGEQVIAHDLDVRGTVLGGLSGIDYRASTGDYVLISDDRSERDAARFYTARFTVDGDGVGPVTFTGTHPLLDPAGAEYPAKSVDPEEIRVDPWTGDYFWTQEGERADGVLIDPSVRIARPDGTYAGDLPIPDNERMRPDTGPRRNAALEAATFAAGGTLFVTALEGPLLEDGPGPTTGGGSLNRLTVQARFGPVLAQYLYPTEPVFAASRPEPGRGDNGIVSILAADALNPSTLLVLERGFVPGVGTKIRLYEADLTAATDVHGTSVTDARPATKRLVADLDELGLSHVDNIEGMTWGPRLATGERTLILVSDNNFSAEQVTQLVALAIR